MKIVYLIRSQRVPDRIYVGICSNLKSRLADHNGGECKATSAHRPWQLESAILFKNDRRAQAFEQYLKTGSGRAFSKRHL